MREKNTKICEKKKCAKLSNNWNLLCVNKRKGVQTGRKYKTSKLAELNRWNETEVESECR